MKKGILTSLVVICFAVYSFHERTDNEKPVISTGKPSFSTQASSSGQSEINTNTPVSKSSPTYKNGQYTGSIEDAYYGYIQVKAIIQNGKLADIVFLQHPSDRATSEYINSQAMPLLKQEAVKAQTAQVNIISGATDTSQAFIQSLATALNSAKV